jgi:membrane protein DedA with SNARE-associated domain
MRIFGTCVVFFVALAVTAAVTLFAVLLLAGPHGGVLPSSLHSATLVLGWLVVAIVPIFAGRWAWRWLARPRS